ncbi:MAG: ethanolamine ammonia-lyase small subunit [Flavobacterium sp.]|jgi:ethanolamine ammonia-lyase small subunit
MEKDNWNILKNYTNARIALGRAGTSLPTTEVLQFRMAHALAKDAISAKIDVLGLNEEAEKIGMNTISIKSNNLNRIEYLQNPNNGRLLDEESKIKLQNLADKKGDLCIIIADGLSADAVNFHALNLINALIPKLKIQIINPLIIVKYGRVAISDVIGKMLNASIAIILIGERPGLSSPNSMGAYVTYNPKPGNTDEKRNCVSNIQFQGLNYEFAAMKLAYLVDQMVTKKISGVQIKDNFSDYYLP